MLYAHRNIASDNRVRCERKAQQKEGSQNAGFPQFILWISTKCILSDKAWVNLESSGIFFWFFLGFGYKITEKPRIPSDNLDPASSLQYFSSIVRRMLQENQNDECDWTNIGSTLEVI